MLLPSLFAHPLSFLLFALSLMMAISVHECAHAYMADRLGDPTPRLQGRLTLNPLAHLDPIGTLMMLLVRFGWGKPVQFDPFNLRNPRRDAALISIAGPISNIVMATIAALLYRLAFALLHPVTILLADLLTQFITLNVVLAIFNLVPIHPLDGFKIVGGMLPEDKAMQWMELERYGMIFLLFLLFPILSNSPPIFTIIGPIINFILNILLPSASFI